MLKRLVFGGAIVGLLAFLVVGDSALYHVKEAFSWAREGVQNSVPIEAQLDQASDMIEDIEPEIEDCRRRVVEEQVEIEYLEREIAALEHKIHRDGNAIQARNASLKSGETRFIVAGRPYSKKAMLHQVSLALEKHRQNSALLTNKRRLLEARTSSLAAAQYKLETVRAEKANLEIAVEHLRAQLRETQAMDAMSSRFHLDDTKLAEVNGILAKCRKRLDVTRKLLETEAPVLEVLPEPETSVGDVTAEVDRYFGLEAVPAQVEALSPVVSK